MRLLILLILTLFLGCNEHQTDFSNELQSESSNKSRVDLRDGETRIRLLEDMYWEIENTSGIWIKNPHKIAIQSHILGLIFQEVTFGENNTLPE